MLPLVWSKTKWLSQSECSRRKSYMNRTLWLYLDVGKGTCNSNRSNKLAIPGTTPFPHTSSLLQCLHWENCQVSLFLSQGSSVQNWRNDDAGFVEELYFLVGKISGTSWKNWLLVVQTFWWTLICGKESIHHYMEVFTWCNCLFLSRPKFMFFLQLKVRYPWDEVRTLVLNQRGPTEVIGRLPRCNSDVFLPHLTKSLHLSRVQMV